MSRQRGLATKEDANLQIPPNNIGFPIYFSFLFPSPLLLQQLTAMVFQVEYASILPNIYMALHDNVLYFLGSGIQ